MASGVVYDRRAVFTTIRAAKPGPVDYLWPRGEAGQPLTLIEARALAEVIEHGTFQAAAACLGRSVQTVKNHMTMVHVKTGYGTMLEALRALGWLHVPRGLGHAA